MDKKAKNDESQEESAVSCESPEKEGRARVQWLQTDILALVDQVSKNWSDFQGGVRKKKYIWRDIASNISRGAFKVTADDCDRKWRNLKIRYLTVRRAQMVGEKIAYRVDYFRKIDQFLRDDPSVNYYLQQRCVNMSASIKQSEDADDADFSDMTSDGTMVWTEKSITLLLNLLDEFKDWFSDKDADRDDSAVWEAISEQMKLEGHRPGPEQCCRKWNNLVSGFYHHKAEAEATGTLPLWPYYTRVRQLINNVTGPLTNTSYSVKRSKGSGGNVKKRKKIFIKQEMDVEDFMEHPGNSSMDEHGSFSGNANNSAINDSGCTGTSSTNLHVPSSGEMQDICRRLSRLEESVGICRRLDRLEAKLDDANQLHEVQQQTNLLLEQALSELSRLSRNLASRYHPGSSRESGDISSGITIIVPNSSM